MMTRADLWWSLSAVLPHAGNYVALSLSDGSLTVWGTDNYTVGMAKVDCESDCPLFAVLPPNEALTMMRYVRPERKSEERQGAQLLTHDNELHVGFYDLSDLPYQLVNSQVYRQAPVSTSVAGLGFLRDWFAQSYARSPIPSMVYQGALLTRFDKAVTRGTLDRVRFYPREHDDRHGVALVTVGERFMGAISALTYDTPGTDIPSEWLDGDKDAQCKLF